MIHILQATLKVVLRRELYDLTHSAPYQLTNAGLQMAAPYTYGIAAIPASVMSSAAIASDANDIVDNGIDIGNGINTVFDVATLVPGAAVMYQMLREQQMLHRRLQQLHH